MEQQEGDGTNVSPIRPMSQGKTFSSERFLLALHIDGVQLAMVIDNETRWVGVRKHNELYWLVEGVTASGEAAGSQTKRYTCFPNYDVAMDAFMKWWDAGFPARPMSLKRSAIPTLGEGRT